jgi:hypothetical protein
MVGGLGSPTTALHSAISWAFVRWWVDRGAAGCAVLNGRFVWNPCGVLGFCRGSRLDSRRCPPARLHPVLRKSWQWWQGARPSFTCLPDRRVESRAFGHPPSRVPHKGRASGVPSPVVDPFVGVAKVGGQLGDAGRVPLPAKSVQLELGPDCFQYLLDLVFGQQTIGGEVVHAVWSVVDLGVLSPQLSQEHF